MKKRTVKRKFEEKKNLTPQKEEAKESQDLTEQKATPENKNKRKYGEFEGKENKNPTPQKEAKKDIEEAKEDQDLTPQKEEAKEDRVEEDYKNTEETSDDRSVTPTIIRSYGRDFDYDYRDPRNNGSPESKEGSIFWTPDTNNSEQGADRHDETVDGLASLLWGQDLATPPANQNQANQTNEDELAGVARNLEFDGYYIGSSPI